MAITRERANLVRKEIGIIAQTRQLQVVSKRKKKKAIPNGLSSILKSREISFSVT